MAPDGAQVRSVVRFRPGLHQLGLPVRGPSLVGSAERQDENVDRAGAQIEDQDLLVLLLVEPICEGRGGRPVDAEKFSPA